MNIENTKAQMRRGILEMCILSIISEGEVYPSDIINKLKQSELIVVEGTLYPLLTRLKNADILNYQWKESTSGPPRKYYHLTTAGTLFLTELQQAWESISTAVSKAIRTNEKIN